MSLNAQLYQSQAQAIVAQFLTPGPRRRNLQTNSRNHATDENNSTHNTRGAGEPEIRKHVREIERSRLYPTRLATTQRTTQRESNSQIHR